MVTKVKRVNMSTPAWGRSVSWSSATDFDQGDVLDIQGSLMRPATWVEISVGAGGSCTVLVNAMHVRFPPYQKAVDVGVSAPDLSAGAEVIDETALSYTLTSGEVLTIDDIPVGNLYFSALADVITVSAG